MKYLIITYKQMCKLLKRNEYKKVYSMNKTYLYGNVRPQTYIYYRDNEKVYVEIIKYSDCTKNTEKELRDKYENL